MKEVEGGCTFCRRQDSDHSTVGSDLDNINVYACRSFNMAEDCDERFSKLYALYVYITTSGHFQLKEKNKI